MTGTSPCRLCWLGLGATLRWVLCIPWDPPGPLLTTLGMKEGLRVFSGSGILWVQVSLALLPHPIIPST